VAEEYFLGGGSGGGRLQELSWQEGKGEEVVQLLWGWRMRSAGGKGISCFVVRWKFSILSPDLYSIQMGVLFGLLRLL